MTRLSNSGAGAILILIGLAWPAESSAGDTETLAWLPIERVGSIERLQELGARVTVKEGIVREVDLTNSTLGDADMEILHTLTSLEQLILNGCANLTDAGLAGHDR